MSEEEYMECSVVAYPRQIKFLHINGGAISYYVDRHVSDYVDRLQQENQELKKQLHEASIEMQEMIEQDIECPSNCSKLKEIHNTYNRKPKEICPKCHKKSLFMTNSKNEVYCIRCNNLVAIKK